MNKLKIRMKTCRDTHTHTHTHTDTHTFPLRRTVQSKHPEQIFLLYYSYIDFKYTILQCIIGIVMEMRNKDRLLRNCKRLMENPIYGKMQ